MKKISLIAFLGAMVVASAAHAGFGLPKVNTGNSTVNNAVNKGIDKGKNKAVEKMINDKLSKHGCQFKDDKTTNATTCNLDKVISELKSWKGGLENTIVNNVSVNVKASAKGSSSLASTRAQEVRTKLYSQMSWWDYSVTSNTNEGNNLAIWVTVR